MKNLAVAAVALSLIVPAAAVALPRQALERLDAAMVASHRSPNFVARDKYRHPVQTLNFFDVRPSDTVVEIWPGGGYWTELLAPYLASGGGRLVVATPPGRATEGIAAKLSGNPTVYGRVMRANFPVLLGGAGVPDNSVDKVLTFRNAHNWRGGYLKADRADYSAEAFAEMYRMLKPGGVLGIEDHRLPENADSEREKTSGYIKVSTIRRLAEQAGFRFDKASEINANRRDTKDYPKGVWTLPPTFAEGDKDRARYAAIGESDRMTLRFVKPAR